MIQFFIIISNSSIYFHLFSLDKKKINKIMKPTTIGLHFCIKIQKRTQRIDDNRLHSCNFLLANTKTEKTPSFSIIFWICSSLSTEKHTLFYNKCHLKHKFLLN